ncbi:hypothetical protein, partial [Porphyromonas loveana]|uniref:hypothetical protein n=1 Tax=Porphyromonas loveana TaxID=1884669 RepID=UPI0035A07405
QRGKKRNFHIHGLLRKSKNRCFRVVVHAPKISGKVIYPLQRGRSAFLGFLVHSYTKGQISVWQAFDEKQRAQLALFRSSIVDKELKNDFSSRRSSTKGQIIVFRGFVDRFFTEKYFFGVSFVVFQQKNTFLSRCLRMTLFSTVFELIGNRRQTEKDILGLKQPTI